MLHLVRVNKSFDSTRAVDCLDLEVPAGETVALIGRSGCGKSTVLRLIIGLLRPDSGEVRIDGAPLRAESLRAMRRRMGYVIQSGGLFPHLTARDNAALQARDVGWDEARIAERLDHLLELTHLDPAHLERFPAQLSGGQRQRVSLVRALMLDPDVLLLDEPLGALDPMIRVRLQDDLKEIFAALGKTVVLVTHDLAEADYFAHRIVLMHHGKIVQQGSFADLRDRPADDFVRRFVRAQRRPGATE
ncbi:MAG: ATP-binding cassette domain-containing protein [Thermoanaerobaculia bacterium]